MRAGTFGGWCVRLVAAAALGVAGPALMFALGATSAAAAPAPYELELDGEPPVARVATTPTPSPTLSADPVVSPDEAEWQ